MANPFEKLKKLKGRSLKEIQTRGEQAVSAYTEKLGFRKNSLSDEDLLKAVTREAFSPSIRLSPRAIFERFYLDSKKKFFPGFLSLRETSSLYHDLFGVDTAASVVVAADKIVDGRFDLLGYLNLEFGKIPDWHYEPLTDKNIPVEHWKEYDEANLGDYGDLKVVWELNRHQYFFTLGVAYRLTGDEKYAECFETHFLDWIDQNPPGMGINWVSSLELAFRSISWIWAFNMFRGSRHMTSDLFCEGLKCLIAHGRHIEQYLSTYFSPNTHLTGEALALYYLGTQCGFLKEARGWRETGERILVEEIDRQIRPDGVYFEQSTWYQRYTTDFYLHFLILSKRSGKDLTGNDQFKVTRGLKGLLESQIAFTRPDGTTPLIGDDDGGRLLPLTTDQSDDFRGTMALGSVIFGRGDFKWIAGRPYEELVWMFGKDGVAKFESIRPHRPEHTSKAFEDSGFYTMRDGWSSDDSYLLFDAGEVGSLKGGHGHADSLGIELAVGGRTMLVDPGTYTYHKSKELRDHFRSTVAHNCLTVGDRSSSRFGDKFSWDSMAEAEVREWISQERFDFIEAVHDGFGCIEDSPVEYNRSVLFLKNDYWIMRDFVQVVGEHEYELNFHFDAETNPVIENIDNGMWCVSEESAGDIGLRLFTFGDFGGWQRKESWVSRCYGERINAPFLRYRSKGVGPQEFITFMVPIEAGFYRPRVQETEVIGGRAFVISYRDYHDLFVFADTSRVIRTELFNTDFKFLWARMSDTDDLPEEFVLVDGTHFTLGGREIVNYPNPLKFATARRFGSKLNVRTSENVFSVSLPQKKSKTFVLKTTPEIS